MNTKARLNPLYAAAKFSLLTLIALCCLSAGAQSFSSGSDGSDGPFDLTGTPSGTTVTFVPTNFPGDQHALGIYNFTNINIPTGVTVRLSALHLPGPVYWLASGNVTINGTVDLSGKAGYPATISLSGRLRQMDAGAGGYAGGMGADNLVASTAAKGDGPGGGAAGYFGPYGINNVCYNNEYGYGSPGTFGGNSFLVPLVGGSGGGGGYSAGTDPLYFGGSGGAGGGGILIASSTSITVNGSINATGGLYGTASSNCTNSGGSGSGGAIHLATNTLAGTGSLLTGNGSNGGVVRIEAFNTSFSGSITAMGESSDVPTVVVLPTQPQASISVVSISNATLPATPTASLAAPDATIDSTSAVTITVQGTNIPVGTVVTLHLYSDNTSTDQTVNTTPLVGTLASSTATATVTFPSGYSMNYVKATWTGSY